MKETNVFKTAFKVFLITYVVFTLFNGLIHLFQELFFTLPEDRLEEIFKSMKIGSWGIFVLIAFIAPFIEELIFRLPLVFKIQYISVILAILVTYRQGFLIGLLVHIFINFVPATIYLFQT